MRGLNPVTGKFDRDRTGLRPNPFTGELQFSGGGSQMGYDPSTNRMLFKGGSSAPVDPLLGIPNLGRWCGTKDIATSGLYLDTACTMPITAEWDLVAGIKDQFSDAILGVQSDEEKQGYAVFAGDGTVCILTDGVDDWYDTGITMGGSVTYSAVLKSTLPAWPNYPAILESGDLADIAKRWGLFDVGTATGWHAFPYPQTVRKDGVDLASPFDLITIDEWFAMTVKTNNATSATRVLFKREQYDYFGGMCCQIFINDPSNSIGQTNFVDAFAQLITPTS